MVPSRAVTPERSRGLSSILSLPTDESLGANVPRLASWTPNPAALGSIPRVPATSDEDVPLTTPSRPAFVPYPTPPKGPEEPK